MDFSYARCEDLEERGGRDGISISNLIMLLVKRRFSKCRKSVQEKSQPHI